MQRIKRAVILITVIAIIVIAGGLIACNNYKPKKLETPVNIALDDMDILTWDSVDGATSYVVDINGTEYETKENSLDIFLITDKPMTYTIKVMAYGSLETHIDSEWSEAFEYKVRDFYMNGFKFAPREENTEEFELIVEPAYMSGKIIIPAIEQLTEIPYDSFRNCTNITSVIIPDNITKIGMSAFSKCTNLKRVKFSDNVTIMPGSCFLSCAKLTEISNYGGVREIRGSAFANCESLKQLTFSDELTKIGPLAFCRCKNLEKVEYSDNLTYLDYEVFKDCTNFKSVYIPPYVKKIHSDAFMRCYNLADVTVNEKNQNYKLDGNCLIRKSDNALMVGFNNCVIPDYVTSIEKYALYGRTLESIVIPDTVKSISRWGIVGCNITQLHIPSSVESIEEQSIYENKELKSITVDENNKNFKAEGNCLINKSDGTLLVGCPNSVIPNDVKRIGQFAFYEYEQLKRMIIPKGVTEIGGTAFCNTGLEYVSIPDSVVKIEGLAFRGCTSLKSVVIPLSVAEIGTEAFVGTTVYAAADTWQPGWVVGSPTMGHESALHLCAIVFGVELKEDDGMSYVYSLPWHEKTIQTAYTFSSTDEQKAQREDLLDNPRVPQRDGYEFKGWATEEGGEPVYLPYATENGEIAAFSKAERDATPYGTTLYSVWEAMDD